MPKLIYDTRQLPVTLTTAEVARMLRCSESYVCRLCRKGELKAKKIGRDWLILKNDLFAYLNTPGEITSDPIDMRPLLQGSQR